MPVEIKKLIVKAIVDSPRNGNEEIAMQNALTSESFDQEILIKNCVKQVLQILKQNKQR